MSHAGPAESSHAGEGRVVVIPQLSQAAIEGTEELKQVFTQDHNPRSFGRIAMGAGVQIAEAFPGAYAVVKNSNPDYYRMPPGSRVISVKTESTQNLRVAIQQGRWSFVENVSLRVKKLYDELKRPDEYLLFLIAINTTKQYSALARVTGPWDTSTQVEGWTEGSRGSHCVGSIPITFEFIKNVPYARFHGLKQERTNQPIVNMWNGMHFDPDVGRQVIEIYVREPHMSNLVCWPKNEGRNSSSPSQSIVGSNLSIGHAGSSNTSPIVEAAEHPTDLENSARYSNRNPLRLTVDTRAANIGTVQPISQFDGPTEAAASPCLDQVSSHKIEGRSNPFSAEGAMLSTATVNTHTAENDRAQAALRPAGRTVDFRKFAEAATRLPTGTLADPGMEKFQPQVDVLNPSTLRQSVGEKELVAVAPCDDAKPHLRQSACLKPQELTLSEKMCLAKDPKDIRNITINACEIVPPGTSLSTPSNSWRPWDGKRNIASDLSTHYTLAGVDEDGTAHYAKMFNTFDNLDDPFKKPPSEKSSYPSDFRGADSMAGFKPSGRVPTVENSFSFRESAAEKEALGRHPSFHDLRLHTPAHPLMAKVHEWCETSASLPSMSQTEHIELKLSPMRLPGSPAIPPALLPRYYRLLADRIDLQESIAVMDSSNLGAFYRAKASLAEIDMAIKTMVMNKHGEMQSVVAPSIAVTNSIIDSKASSSGGLSGVSGSSSVSSGGLTIRAGDGRQLMSVSQRGSPTIDAMPTGSPDAPADATTLPLGVAAHGHAPSIQSWGTDVVANVAKIVGTPPTSVLKPHVTPAKKA